MHLKMDEMVRLHISKEILQLQKNFNARNLIQQKEEILRRVNKFRSAGWGEWVILSFWINYVGGLTSMPPNGPNGFTEDWNSFTDDWQIKLKK